MKIEFKQALSRSGNIINPDKIIITDSDVTWEKRKEYLIGKDSKTIPINEVSSVELENTGWGTNIIINSRGSGAIHANSFTISDAKEIKRLIQDLKQKQESSSFIGTKNNQIEEAERDIEKEERRENKRNEKYKYIKPNRIALITFGDTSSEILDELNIILSFYNQLTGPEKNEDEANLIIAYDSKISEGLRKLESLLLDEPSLCNNIDSFKKELGQISEKIIIKKNKIKSRKKIRLIIFLSIIGFFVIFNLIQYIIVYNINSNQSKNYNEIAKVKPFDKKISGDLADYLEVVSNQYEITYDFGGKMSILISAIKKMPKKKLTNKKVELNLSLFDSTGVPLSGTEDFVINTKSEDKIKRLLCSGTGQEVIQFEAPIGLYSYQPEKHAKKAKQFKICSYIKTLEK